MLLRSIKLKNFRQFKRGEIDFASGENGKNVTIILGENGTGKTTFAQAFFWCLYGETSFIDKVIINRLITDKLLPGQSDEVSVELKLEHGANHYTLTREQVYTKDNSGNLKASNTIFDIKRRDKSGNTKTISPALRESEVNSILPKELSRYFFFDGERIERMSKDISNHKKAVDFADAVKSLLGLKGVESAIKHFNPNSKYCVIGSYDDSYDASSNKKIREYTKTINDCKEQLIRINNRIDELDEQIRIATERRNLKSEEIKQFEEGEKLQSDREKIKRKIDAANKAKSNSIKSICSVFSTNANSFLSVWMIQRAMNALAAKDFTGKDIPHMHGDTISYLLDRHLCICGTQLNEGSMAYEKVKSLIEFLPPKSLKSNISDFKKVAIRRVNTAQQTDVNKNISDSLGIIRVQEEDISSYNEELTAIDKKLAGKDVREKVRTINAEIQQCDKTIESCNNERDQKIEDRGAVQGRMERADSLRGQLALRDEMNKKIQIYKVYAEAIYNDLLNFYKTSEIEVRKKLEDTINDIFKQIYEGGLSLSIDDKYRISVYVNEFEGDVEASTAQNISVIFAFITGIIKLARDNRDAINENDRLLSSEPYPLVMDAPLSAFDKRRIKTVCTALPEIAEQVIIFIKDTDGNLAEEYMGEWIGTKHHFVKLNEFETKLI